MQSASQTYAFKAASLSLPGRFALQSRLLTVSCLFFQLDDGSEDMMMGGGQGDEEESEGDDLPQGITPELRLVPQDASKGT